jgi:hypothetical protein
MRTSLIICASPFVVGLVVSLALANPDMLRNTLAIRSGKRWIP